TKPDMQTSLRLPRDLYERLSEAAAENDHGVGEEMRQRLTASLKSAPAAVGDEQPRDQLTLQFAEASKVAAANLALVLGPWHKDPFAFAIFKVAVNTLLENFQPEGDPVPP